MTKLIKTSLVALSLLAGASVGYAADNGRDGRDFGRDSLPENRLDAPDLQQRKDLDMNSTGSIRGCETQTYDDYGNCVVDPDADTGMGGGMGR